MPTGISCVMMSLTLSFCFFIGRMLSLLLFASALCTLASGQSGGVPLETLIQWTRLEFEYSTESLRQKDISTGFFREGVPVPIDMDIFYSKSAPPRFFVSIPRFQLGNPVALGEVTSKLLNGNPVIRPYPDWSWHRDPETCPRDRIISVYRVQIDRCGRMWVLDTGRYGDRQICAPQILAFDVANNRLIHRFEIPISLYEPRSILVTPVVDIRDNFCTDTFVYIADCQAFSIIVYDVRRARAWRAIDKTMYPHPYFGTYKIEGDQFDLMDGVLGMALGPLEGNRDRKLFYSAMSSNALSWVYTSYLRNQTLFLDDPSSSPFIFNTFNTRRPSQSAAMAIDNQGVAYFGLHSQSSINCWNTQSNEYGRYIDAVSRSSQQLQFAAGVKVITNLDGYQELWTLTNRFQKVAVGGLSNREVNFRVSGVYVNDTYRTTGCRTPNQVGYNFGGYTHTIEFTTYDMH